MNATRQRFRTAVQLPVVIFLIALFKCLLGASAIVAQTGIEWQSSAWQLWRINVDGGLKQLTTTPGFRCGSPDWSPDGQFIAFDVIKSGQAWDESQISVIAPMAQIAT